MSLQNGLNLYLSATGSALRTIVLEGLSGDLDVPEQCYVLLRGCTVGALTVATNCVIVVEQSILQGAVVIADGCTVTLDASVVSNTVSISNSKGTLKNCNFSNSLTIVGTALDAYVCAFAGNGTGIAMDQGSNVIVRGSTFSSNIGATVAGDSQLNLYNTNFSTNQGCISATTGIVNCYGGILNSGNGTCIQAVSSSKIVLSGIASATGQVGVINIDSTTVMQVHNSGGFTSANNAIVITGGATLEIYQLANLTSTLTTISISTGGQLTISEVPNINSSKAEAININGGTLFGRSLGVIRGMTSAFVTQNSSLIRILGFTEIRADKQVCINSGDSDDYQFTNGNLIQADLDTLVTGTNGHYVFRDVNQLNSPLQSGIILGDSAQVEIFNAQSVSAYTTAAIQVGNGGQVLLSFCALVQMLGQGDGVVLGTNGFFRMTDSGTLVSQKQNALTAGAGTSIEIVTFQTIQSVKQYAMAIDGCQLVLRQGTQVLGGEQGGIQIGGSAGTADIEQVALLDGGLGEALYMNNGVLNLADCTKVNAGSNGIHLDTGTVANIVQLATVVGGQSGIVVTNGSNLAMNGTTSVQGISGPALSFDSSEVDLISVTTASSAAGSLSVSNNSKVSIRGTTFAGGDIVCQNSDLTLLSCVNEKNLTSTNTVLVLNRCNFQGNTNTVTSGILDAQNTSFVGSMTLSQVTIKYVLVTHQDQVTSTDCAGLLLSCQFVSWSNIEGSILSIGNSGVITNATPGSIVDIQKGGLTEIQATEILLVGDVSMG